MTTNFQFKSALSDHSYAGQGYDYTIGTTTWITIYLNLLSFGHFISLMSDVCSGAILELNRAKLFDHFELKLSAPTTGGGGEFPEANWNI